MNNILNELNTLRHINYFDYNNYDHNKLFIDNNSNHPYLTEKILGDYLKLIFPEYNFIHNKKVPNSHILNRPDYHCEELKLIVEFDGYRHYSVPKTILSDYIKDRVYQKMGYNVVRIPYFVQLTPNIIELLFNKKNVNLNIKFPHGFISQNCMLPAEFCVLGIKRFIHDCNRFTIIYKDIKQSLINKIQYINNIDLVLPLQL